MSNSEQSFNSWYLSMLGLFASGADSSPSHLTQERIDKYSLTQMQFATDLERHGLPLLHVKPTPWRGAVKEMLWFISSSFDYADLHNEGCTWWAPWMRSIAPAGFKWPCDSPHAQRPSTAPIESLPVSNYTLPYKKHHSAFNRIAKTLAEGDFDSTRLYCNLWPCEDDLHLAVLPPCALAYQVTVEHGRLNMSVTQRSADFLCGVPANAIQYAFLTHLYATIAGLRPGKLVFNFGDLHVYKQHLLQPEWRTLNNADRWRESEMLRDTHTSYSFDGLRAQAGGEWLPAAEADVAWAHSLHLDNSYKHCGKLKFPVVQIHTGVSRQG